MPHKRNPIGSENMTGMARVIRGYMLTAYENVPLWHERDISHSSAERIIITRRYDCFKLYVKSLWKHCEKFNCIPGKHEAQYGPHTRY